MFFLFIVSRFYYVLYYSSYQNYWIYQKYLTMINNCGYIYLSFFDNKKAQSGKREKIDLQ